VLDSLFGIEWELAAAAVIDHGPSLSQRGTDTFTVR
jgi:hypothetical protein